MINDSYTLNNKVDLLPIISNYIGIDKLIFDYPYSTEIINRLNLENKLYTVTEEGEIKKINGEICNGLRFYTASGYIRFILNPAIYLYQNNFYTVCLKHIRHIFNSLKDKLKIDLDNSIIRRIDLQSTFLVKQKPATYYEILGTYKSFNRSVFSSTLYYNSKSERKYKTGLFYDKKKKEKSNSPLQYKEKECLRIEWQYYNVFLKNFAKKHDIKKLKLKNILEKHIYNSMLKMWYLDYKNIYKERIMIFNMKIVNRISDVDNMLIMKGIEHIGGMDMLEKIINTSKNFIARKSDFFSKMKRRYRDKSKLPNHTMINPLINELNDKVSLAYTNSKNGLDK